MEEFVDLWLKLLLGMTLFPGHHFQELYII